MGGCSRTADAAGVSSALSMSTPRRWASATTRRLAVRESCFRWVGFKSARRRPSSASKAAAAWLTSCCPAAVMFTCTLRRSSGGSVRGHKSAFLGPIDQSRHARLVQLEESGQFVDGRAIGHGGFRAVGPGRSTDRGPRRLAPEHPVHDKGQLGQRVHQTEVSLEPERGDTGPECWQSADIAAMYGQYSG